MYRFLLCTALVVGFPLGQISFAQEPKTLLTLKDEPDGEPFGAVVSPDGKMLAIRGGYVTPNEVTVRELPSGKILQRMKCEGRDALNVLRNMAFSPDGKLLAVHDENIYLLDLQSGKSRKLTDLPAFEPRILAFLADSTKVVIRRKEASGLKTWDVKTDKDAGLGAFATISGDFTDLVRDQIAFSKDSKWVAHSADFTDHESDIALLPLSMAKAKWKALKGHEGEILALAFSADGKTLVSAAIDQTIRQWDPQSGKETAKVKVDLLAWPKKDRKNITAHFNADGSMLAIVIGTEEKKAYTATVTLVETKSGKVLATAKETVHVQFAGFLPETNAVIYLLPGSNKVVLQKDRATVVRQLEVGGKK